MNGVVFSDHLETITTASGTASASFVLTHGILTKMYVSPATATTVYDIKITEENVGGLEEVVQELVALSSQISAYTATLTRAQHDYDNKVPELTAKLDTLAAEAKKLDMPEYMPEECLAKLRQFNII